MVGEGIEIVCSIQRIAKFTLGEPMENVRVASSKKELY